MIVQGPQHGRVAIADEDGWIHGFFYLADQHYLVFGQNRSKPVTWRPVVSVRKTGAGLLVLPATSQVRSGFFRLRPGDVFVRKPPPTSLRDSYLCYRPETVLPDALRLVGVLRHGLRIQIMEWLNECWGDSSHAER